jgi:AcrR family transcriptional regulator
MPHEIHPTKARLIETTTGFLAKRNPTDITVDQILEASGISKGSLYHHFEDFSELLEIAQVVKYSQWVDKSIELIVSVIAGVKSRDELVAGVKTVTRATQGPEFSEYRFDRARIIAQSSTSLRFKESLGVEQARLTSALEDLFREAAEKGWCSPHLDARTLAVFIQAYTLGKIVDDIVKDRIDPESWNSLIDTVVDRVFLT